MKSLDNYKKNKQSPIIDEKKDPDLKKRPVTMNMQPEKETVIIYEQSNMLTAVKKLIRTLIEVVITLLVIAVIVIGVVYIAADNAPGIKENNRFIEKVLDIIPEQNKKE